jgi:hypothetical protein
MALVDLLVRQNGGMTANNVLVWKTLAAPNNAPKNVHPGGGAQDTTGATHQGVEPDAFIGITYPTHHGQQGPLKWASTRSFFCTHQSAPHPYKRDDRLSVPEGVIGIGPGIRPVRAPRLTF